MSKLSKSYQSCFAIKLPTGCHTLQWVRVHVQCFSIIWSPHWSQPEDWTLPTSVCVCVGQWRSLVTEPPSHRRLSAYVGVHYASPPVCREWACDAWLVVATEMPLRTQAERKWMYYMWVQKCSEDTDAALLSDALILSVPFLLGWWGFAFPSTLTGFCYCCANMFKLMNIQVLTCPYTSLTGLIIHCCIGPQPRWPYYYRGNYYCQLVSYLKDSERRV